MRRVHLFEIEDQSWCPNFLRNFLTDYLKQFERMFNIYDNTIPIIEKGLAHASTRRVIDLCSGASGPWSQLILEILDTEVYLTDMYPNQARVDLINDQENSSLKYCPSSVNAMSVPKELTGLRTLFTSFHHFEPEKAIAILFDAKENNAPIAIFEFTERSVLNALFHPIVTPFIVFWVSLFIRPIKLSRIVLTYLIPLVLLIVMWDGYISNLRTYSLSELDHLTQVVGKDKYEWETGKLKTNFPSISVTYLLGFPKKLF